MGWLLATLLGCHGLSQTGPTGMKGVVLDAQGYPVTGLRMASVEAEGETDAEGGFAVAYKSDAPYLQFRHLGAWYRRHYQPEDHGQRVRLALPQTRNVEVECPGQPVQVEFNWTLGLGFDAYLQFDCLPGDPVAVQGVPVGSPTVKARQSVGEETAVQIADQGSVWVLEVPGSATVFEVQVPGTGDVRCDAVAGDRVLPRMGPRRFALEMDRPAWLRVTCDGRPAVPVHVSPGDDDIDVHWSPTGPGLNLSLPESEFGWLVAEGAGWTLPLTGTVNVHIPLPVLAPDTYRLMVTLSPVLPAEALVARAPELGPPGICRIRGSDGVDVGRFRVEALMRDGVVDVVGVP